MSTLLDEAIVDATELKKAAIKNAESTILEKYSAEIKSAVDVLLEQDAGLEAMFSDDSIEDMAAAETPALGEEEQAIVDQIPYVGSETLGKNGSDTALDAPDSEEEEATVVIDLENLAKTLNPDLYKDEKSIDQEEESSIENMAAPEGEEAVAMMESLMEDEDLLQEALNLIVEEDIKIDAAEEKVKSVLESIRFDYEPKPSGWAPGGDKPTSEQAEMLELLKAKQDLEEANKELEDRKDYLTSELSELRESFDILENIHQDLKDKNLKLMQLARKLEGKLNEVNLANAKLTYTNRALNSSSLNERQKQKLVESISKANTIEEAKVIYETLEDTIGSFSKNERKPKNLSEAISRSASPFFPNRETSESNEQKIFANRMKRLAGINS